MDRISIEECAKKMKASQQFVRIGLQTGRLPFGYAVKMSNRWTYWISRERFEQFLRDGK